ncbi:MAG: YkgJ family cysteine cluster protein [Bdellovibrionaceae bacterium]|mgnify:CR=1 FL=1|jgi:uncharacterized protein|nr:YkgJ family cysteine cluster protein [Pseudobdellovibrionaceae bacterium]
MKKVWYDKGIRFQCQGTGQCCLNHGQYNYVFLTLKNRQDIAKLLKLSTQKFTKNYCTQTDGSFYLNPNNEDESKCIFLNDNKCQVYKARPTQCSTWPFWPSTLNKKVWNKEVVPFCKGVGEGKLYSYKEIEAIKNLELKAEKEIFNED